LESLDLSLEALFLWIMWRLADLSSKENTFSSVAFVFVFLWIFMALLTMLEIIYETHKKILVCHLLNSWNHCFGDYYPAYQHAAAST